MTTMRDVAAVAGVSQKTVSRVYNGDPHVLPETRERVLKVLEELRYTPNALATTFRAGRAPVIGIAVPDIVDPFFGAIARAVDEEAARHDMSTLVTSIGEDPEREAEIVNSLLTRSPSGLVLASVRPEQSYLGVWLDKLPVVFVDRAPTGVVADSFTDDDLGGARLATADLIGHGHRRIAFVGDRLSLPTTSRRLDGYRQALGAAGLAFDPDLVALGVSDRTSARAALERLRLVEGPPSALFSSNGRVTMFLWPAVKDLPLALCSFGDLPMADSLTPSLTVVDQDPARVGLLAARRVLDRLAYPSRRYKRKTVLEVKLVERQSCRFENW